MNFHVYVTYIHLGHLQRIALKATVYTGAWAEHWGQ